MTISEKRRYRRGPLLLPVTFTMNDVSKKGYLANISAGGCLLFCHFPLAIKVDQPLEITLKLKKSPEEVTLKARVVRTEPFVYNPDYGTKEEINKALGVMFLELDEARKRAIEEYTETVLERMKPG